jgi:hypothetical protein
VADKRPAAHHDHPRPEPVIAAGRGRTGAKDRELATIEGGVRAQPQAHRPVPAELVPAVFRQPVPPGQAGPVAQGAFHDAAAPADDGAAQHERDQQREQHHGSQADCQFQPTRHALYRQPRQCDWSAAASSAR